MSTASSARTAPPRREELPKLRILVAVGERGEGVIPSVRQWGAEAGLEVAAVPDLPRAVRQLAGERWDVVLAVLGDVADEDLTWWSDALRGAVGPPRLIVATHGP